MTTLTRAQVRELDRRAIEEFGVPSVVLMENAGRGAAEVLMRLNPERRPVVVCCGKGNNGGDGLVITRHLDNHGYRVVALMPHCWPPGLSGDVAINYRILKRSRHEPKPPLVWACGVEHNILEDEITLPDVWVVDALFGTGLSGAVREPFDRVIAAINARRDGRILAVDIPSGLDCDTGQPLGPTVRAGHTVTFVAPKAGFTNPAATEWLGELHVAHIGAPRALLEQYAINDT